MGYGMYTPWRLSLGGRKEGDGQAGGGTQTTPSYRWEGRLDRRARGLGLLRYHTPYVTEHTHVDN